MNSAPSIFLPIKPELPDAVGLSAHACDARARQGGGRFRGRGVAGWCALVVYLVAWTPLAPGLTALLATLDASHRVGVVAGAGSVRIVLRHECAGAPRSAGHRHGVIASALTLFALQRSAQQLDHVIQFASLDASQQAPALVAAAPMPVPSPDFLIAADLRPLLFPPFAAPPFLPPAPPDTSGRLLLVRSTVLVI
jgi:hypothetical protein